MTEDAKHTSLTIKTTFGGATIMRDVDDRKTIILDGEEVPLRTGDRLARDGGLLKIECFKLGPRGLIPSP